MSRSHQESIVVNAPPRRVYDLVSDVTRTGEWSPVCRRCEWQDPAERGVGGKFTGFNKNEFKEWETTSTVIEADPGRRFAWQVGEGWVRWGYTLEPSGDGTLLTETWEFTDAGLDRFHRRYGDDAPAEIEQRTRAAHEGIPITLERIKEIAELSTDDARQTTATS